MYIYINILCSCYYLYHCCHFFRRFAVDPATLPEGWKTLFANANDNSNEGVIHQTKPWSSVQFHPEAAGGPMDTAFMFEGFIHVRVTFTFNKC